MKPAESIVPLQAFAPLGGPTKPFELVNEPAPLARRLQPSRALIVHKLRLESIEHFKDLETKRQRLLNDQDRITREIAECDTQLSILATTIDAIDSAIDRS